MELVKIITLSLSGALLVFVGLMRTSNPIATYSKNSGIELDNNVDLLNEMRGVSTLMLLGGIAALLGTFMPALRMTSLAIATLIFIGFAIGRLISIGVDGKPNKKIIQGLMTELILGSANVFCLVASVV